MSIGELLLFPDCRRMTRLHTVYGIVVPRPAQAVLSAYSSNWWKDCFRASAPVPP